MPAIEYRGGTSLLNGTIFTWLAQGLVGPLGNRHAWVGVGWWLPGLDPREVSLYNSQGLHSGQGEISAAHTFSHIEQVDCS